ncbi:MAG: hypothetical protein ACLR7Z_05055 [Bilophila wadsworthia]
MVLCWMRTSCWWKRQNHRLAARILCLRTTPELLTALPEGCKALRLSWRSLHVWGQQAPGLPSFTAEDLDALVDLVLEKGFCCPRWIAELAGKRTVPP